MNPHLISETIRKSIEERRRRQQEQAVEKGPIEPPSANGPAVLREAHASPDLSACAAELGRTVRDSILSSFSQWEVTLIPQIEEMARLVAQSAGSNPDRAAGGSPGQAMPKAPSSPGSGIASGLGGGEPPAPVGREGDAPNRDSWDVLAEAVRELRKEWDQETFESRFGDAPSAPPAPAPGEAAASPPADSREPAASPPAEPPASPDELAVKLDELIRLVKKSIAGPTGERPTAPMVPPELTREIAREIASRLKGEMGTRPAGTPAGTAGAPAATPPAPNRIPLDDVASMIDQITGSTPP